MSIRESDPGYVNLVADAQVFVDGVLTTRAVTADEEAGLVIEYDGAPAGWDWNTVERRGVVRIVIPNESETR